MANSFSSSLQKLRTKEVCLVIDGNGDPIGTGEKAFVRVPFSGVITGWEIIADQSGSIIIDVRKSSYATFPSDSSIAGTEKPTLSSQVKNADTNLSSWNTALAAGDYLKFTVDSVSVVTRITLNLMVRL